MFSCPGVLRDYTEGENIFVCGSNVELPLVLKVWKWAWRSSLVPTAKMWWPIFSKRGLSLVLLVASLLSFHFHGGEHCLHFDPAACKPFVWLFNLTLTSAGISLSLGFESLLCFLACFFSPTSVQLKPSLALVFCFTGNSCSSLFSPLLKTKLSLAVVRFLCFFVHFIHAVVNFRKQITISRLITQKVKFWNRKLRCYTMSRPHSPMCVRGGPPCNDSPQIEMALCLVLPL